MGARHSKRSVDISGGTKEGDDAQPLDGKLEKLEEGAKMAVNGASHSEHNATEKLEEPVSNGDPVSLPEAAVEEAGPSSPSDDVQVESPASETVQPPKKKEKVKKKWSLRSLSFSKKDKSKPTKEESAKEDAEGVPEVTEEKGEEECAGLMSSVTEAISSGTEAVGEALVAAEHKVEEGLTATQDQVEKISAKVAEKAEALVTKMEAMTIQAVDTAQEALGMGHPHETTTEQKTEGTTVTITESTKSCEEALDTAQSKVIEGLVTNVMVPDLSTVDSGVTTVTSITTTESSSGSTVVVETVKTEVMTIIEKEVPSVKEVETVVVTKIEEIPPPLPASPPPTSTVNEVVANVVNSAVNLAETKETTESESNIFKHMSPTAAQAPTTFTEAVPPEVSGGGDVAEEPKEACEPHSPVAMPAVTPSNDSVVGEVVNEVLAQVVTEVIATSEQILAAADLSNEMENGENEEDANDNEDDEASPEVLKKPSEMSKTAEDANEPPPEKSAEE